MVSVDPLRVLVYGEGLVRLCTERSRRHALRVCFLVEGLVRLCTEKFRGCWLAEWGRLPKAFRTRRRRPRRPASPNKRAERSAMAPSLTLLVAASSPSLVCA